MDVPTAGGDTAHPPGDGYNVPALGQGQLHVTSADDFLASATKEYEEGHIDPALWARAAAQFGDDKSLVIAAYLRARATALHVQKRERRLERRAIRAKARQDARKRNVAQSQRGTGHEKAHCRPGTTLGSPAGRGCRSPAPGRAAEARIRRGDGSGSGIRCRGGMADRVAAGQGAGRIAERVRCRSACRRVRAGKSGRERAAGRPERRASAQANRTRARRSRPWCGN